MAPPADGQYDENNNVAVKSMSLEKSLIEVHKVLHLFFENKFDASAKLLESCKHNSWIYDVEAAYQAFCFAIITLEKPLLAVAMEKSKIAVEQVDKKRKVHSIGQTLTGWFSKTNYNDYTDEEALAEILSAELIIMTTLVSFLGDQSLVGLVSGVKKLLSAHYGYKLCMEILNHKDNWESKVVKGDFACSTHAGYGFENLVISHLPARVLKIISLVGFHGDRDIGLKHVHISTDDMKDTHKWKISCFVACGYSFYLEQFFGIGEADIPWIKRITDEALERYPEGAFDLFWSARLKQLSGQTEEAIELFERCIKSQNKYPQLHSVCRWDQLWCYAIQCHWEKAAECAKSLEENCLWSPATNAYQFACFKYMQMEEENRPELRKVVDEAMTRVPQLRQRFIGRTIPPEKFAITMAERYSGGERELVLPALVLFYIWNVYNYSTERPDLMTPLLNRIEGKLRSTTGDFYYVMLLLRGVCLRNAKQPNEALECFSEIIHSQESIKNENYVPPHAAFELGMTYIDVGDYDLAKSWLEKARDSYSGFLVEALVHLRIHGALNKLKVLKRST